MITSVYSSLNDLHHAFSGHVPNFLGGEEIVVDAVLPYVLKFLIGVAFGCIAAALGLIYEILRNR